ncbi:hypothetical protein BRC81_03600 [Halobacteriales archaeon QS_1_68_20]|nr:MAG: hypothetical protein BRC81_03600 [Halobacteriales archaeon QS_1_68_20]
MRCHNCDNAERFVLLVELAVLARGPGEFSDPEWSLSVQCPDCGSTDVSADPGTLLQAGLDE